jgi:hypothetical protein
MPQQQASVVVYVHMYIFPTSVEKDIIQITKRGHAHVVATHKSRYEVKRGHLFVSPISI